MTDDFINSVKERYSFAEWPKETRRREASQKPVLINKSAFSGFTLVRRDSTGQPHSYEDVYVSDTNDDVRVQIRIFNFDSFAEAKDALIRCLAGCANPRIDDWKSDELPVDIGFGAVNEGLRAAMFVSGSVFVEISNIGLQNADLQGFIGALKGQL